MQRIVVTGNLEGHIATGEGWSPHDVPCVRARDFDQPPWHRSQSKLSHLDRVAVRCTERRDARQPTEPAQ
jgi:hypothetical protein